MTDEVTLVARREIAADEELTADYALWEMDPGWISASSREGHDDEASTRVVVGRPAGGRAVRPWAGRLPRHPEAISSRGGWVRPAPSAD
jgi:hypothetical protein